MIKTTSGQETKYFDRKNGSSLLIKIVQEREFYLFGSRADITVKSFDTEIVRQSICDVTNIFRLYVELQREERLQRGRRLAGRSLNARTDLALEHVGQRRLDATRPSLKIQQILRKTI